MENQRQINTDVDISVTTGENPRPADPKFTIDLTPPDPNKLEQKKQELGELIRGEKPITRPDKSTYNLPSNKAISPQQEQQ